MDKPHRSTLCSRVAIIVMISLSLFHCATAQQVALKGQNDRLLNAAEDIILRERKTGSSKKQKTRSNAQTNVKKSQGIENTANKQRNYGNDRGYQKKNGGQYKKRGGRGKNFKKMNKRGNWSDGYKKKKRHDKWYGSSSHGKARNNGGKSGKDPSNQASAGGKSGKYDHRFWAGIMGTYHPTLNPTLSPTLDTFHPTLSPTLDTFQPTLNPTWEPTMTPTYVDALLAPTFIPTLSPTLYPTLVPTLSPTLGPTLTPTFTPTLTPTFSPTLTPTLTPTFTPTLSPTLEDGSKPKDSRILRCPSTRQRKCCDERPNDMNLEQRCSRWGCKCTRMVGDEFI